jgi:hypothetical protein
MRSASHHLYHSINGGISQNVIIFGDEDALGTYVEVSFLGFRAVGGTKTYVGLLAGAGAQGCRGRDRAEATRGT